jgi:hypothetical protein
MLCLGADVGMEPMVSTEVSPSATDVVSWARCVRNACTALHWKESLGCAALLASVSFEVGAVWCDGHVWTVGSASEPLVGGY